MWFGLGRLARSSVVRQCLRLLSDKRVPVIIVTCWKHTKRVGHALSAIGSRTYLNDLT
jgi:hypothetical protein